MPAPTTDLRRQAAIVKKYERDPAWFADQILGVEWWSKQREIAESVRDNPRTAVKACHGPGKSFGAAGIVLWFLRLPRARVITTARTWHQVRNILWIEIAKQYRGAKVPLGGELFRTELQMGDGRYAIGLSTKPEQVESFQGHHAPNLLIVVDEASGVPEGIYEAAEGYMTTAGARMLLIGNPLAPEGEFYKAFTTSAGMYHRISISAYDLPWATGEKVSDQLTAALTSEQWVEDMKKKWGENSPQYQARVLGNFPTSADDAVISLAQVEDAQRKQRKGDGPAVISCDVARYGSDETVIALRHGEKVRILKTYIGKPTTETAGHLIRYAREYEQLRPEIVVDDDGVGGGVIDQLRENDMDVTPFNAGGRPRDPDGYPNVRSEAWFVLSEKLADLDLDEDAQLAGDLTAPRYKVDSQGRRVVEPKDQTKRRIGRSPDRGDAVMMACYPGKRKVPNIGPVSVKGQSSWRG